MSVTDPPDEAFNDVSPLALPESLDLPRLATLLRKIEGRMDAQGWDAPSAGLTLWILYDNSVTGAAEHFDRLMASNPKLGAPLRIGRYSAQTMMPMSWVGKFDGKPHEALRNFAVNTAYVPDSSTSEGHNLGLMRTMIRIPGVLGFAASYEAWSRDRSIEDSVTNRDAHIDWGTLADSGEVRVVLAVDFLDRAHEITRVRGEAAGEPVMDAPVRGDISTSLRILTDVVFSRSPRPSQFHAHYPSMAAEAARALVYRDEMLEVRNIIDGPSAAP